MNTMTEILASALDDLKIDPTTTDGKVQASAIAVRLRQAFELGRDDGLTQASTKCVRLAEECEQKASGLTRLHAKKGQKLVERATGAYRCASEIKGLVRKHGPAKITIAAGAVRADTSNNAH